MTGSDFYEPVEAGDLSAFADVWDRTLPSESDRISRAEFLAGCILLGAEDHPSSGGLRALIEARTLDEGLLGRVRQFAAERYDEGYERGVHDVDAARIVDQLLTLKETAGLLEFDATSRALGLAGWAAAAEEERGALRARSRQALRLEARFGGRRARAEVESSALQLVHRGAERVGWSDHAEAFRRAARYLVLELGQESLAFVLHTEAEELLRTTLLRLEERGQRRPLEDDLALLAARPAEQMHLACTWLQASLEGESQPSTVAGTPDATGPATVRWAGVVMEAAMHLVCGGAWERTRSSARVHAEVAGLLSNHPRIRDGKLEVNVTDLEARLRHAVDVDAPRVRAYRKERAKVLDEAARRLRLGELQPKVLTSFVRNRLIDEVYLPLIGANLAKQIGNGGRGPAHRRHGHAAPRFAARLRQDDAHGVRGQSTRARVRQDQRSGAGAIPSRRSTPTMLPMPLPEGKWSA